MRPNRTSFSEEFQSVQGSNALGFCLVRRTQLKYRLAPSKCINSVWNTYERQIHVQMQRRVPSTLRVSSESITSATERLVTANVAPVADIKHIDVMNSLFITYVMGSWSFRPRMPIRYNQPGSLSSSSLRYILSFRSRWPAGRLFLWPAGRLVFRTHLRVPSPARSHTLLRRVFPTLLLMSPICS